LPAKPDIDEITTDMTEHIGLNLTGIWQGTYYYPFGLGEVSFVATLIESGTSLTGTTHEVEPSAPSVTLCASLSGGRRGSAIEFVKVYDAVHRDPIAYEGTLSNDHTEIQGRWVIANELSGTFRMIRPASKTESLSRKKFEHA
jgi:hypothetical protein